MNNLQSGGAEKSLVSLLQIIDYQQYNVDLLLFKKEGIFLNKLPKEVTVLEAPIAFSYFDMSITSAILQCIKRGKLITLINRILAVFVLKTEKNPAVREQKLWRFLSPCLDSIPKEYDVAIGYLEKTPNYFCIDKTNGAKKLLWIHTNYSNMAMETKYDNDYFQKAHCVVTIATDCAADLKLRFPQFSEKIKVMQNIISPTVIKKLAENKILEAISFNNSIVSVGRLSHEKGADLAIEACKILQQNIVDFQWIFIGDGNQREHLEAKVIEYQLQNHVCFFGEKDNPYAYVLNATIFAQTSRFEGKSIAVDEAKILQKPILATNFSTVITQINHLHNGYIVDMNPEAIANGIQILLSDVSMQERFKHNLSQEMLGTESEMTQFYQLIH